MRRRRLCAGAKSRGWHCRQDVSPESILDSIKSMCRELVSIVKRTARDNPEFAMLLSGAIALTTFWDAVNGLRDIGMAAKRTFDRIMLKLRGEVSTAKRLEAGAIIQKLIQGIGRLGVAFFKVVAARKLKEYATQY